MLKTRILTAIVLVVLLLVVLFWLPKGAAIGFFAALVLAGAWEWTYALGAGTTRGVLMKSRSSCLSPVSGGWSHWVG